jgi:hypothetical protein
VIFLLFHLIPFHWFFFIFYFRGTHFLRELRPGDTISLDRPTTAPQSSPTNSPTRPKSSSNPPSPRPLHNLTQVVAEVISDTEFKLKEPFSTDGELTGEFEFKITPHVDQSGLFEAVYSKLGSGMPVAIFPEGGSHDQTHLLELKAGISVMALGAVAKLVVFFSLSLFCLCFEILHTYIYLSMINWSNRFPGLPLKIIPVGLNYESGHRFRSKVLVDFGEPILIPNNLVEQYKTGGEKKRKACAELLNTVWEGLKEVTVESPDYQTLRLLKLMAKLYRFDFCNFFSTFLSFLLEILYKYCL